MTNGGPGSATGVVLTDTLGANLRFVSATTSQGSFSQSGSVVTFNTGDIGIGATVTVTVTAQALEDGNLTNSAAATATSADPNPANNNAAASATVAEPIIVVSGPITTTLKNPTNVAVATFTHAGGVEPTSAFVATINWGDNRTSTGTITQSGATYTVTGSHRYSGGGRSHTITTTVREINNAAQLLLGKIGDEVPDLPDQHPTGNNGGRPSNNALAGVISSILSQSAPSALLAVGASAEYGGGTALVSPATLDGLVASITGQPDGLADLPLLGHGSALGQFDAGIPELALLLDSFFAELSRGSL